MTESVPLDSESNLVTIICTVTDSDSDDVIVMEKDEGKTKKKVLEKHEGKTKKEILEKDEGKAKKKVLVENKMVNVAPKSRRLDRSAPGPVPSGQQDDTRVYCTNCPKSFAHRKDMLRYRRLRCGQPGENYQCSECRKFFNYEDTLKDHFNRFHAKIRSYKCQVCDESFFYAKDMNKHVKDNH